VVFVDESGFSLIPYVAKTWAPVGQTPVLIHQGRWPEFSAISGVTPRGKLYIQVHKDTVATEQVVEFLEHLLRNIRRRPIMVFRDGGRPHHSDETQAFLRAHPRIEAHRFPGYSPELNPDEWVWRHLKNHELASYAPHDVKELSRELRRAVVRMRVRPKLIRSFVAATHLYD
jgi:transposase